MGQHPEQQFPGGVHHGFHPFPLQTQKNPIVKVLRQGTGNAPGQHQEVPLLQSVQAAIQGFQLFGADFRTSAIDFALLLSLDFHVNPGKARRQGDKIRLTAGSLHEAANLRPGEPGGKSQSPVGNSQIGQHHRHIQPLAAGDNGLFDSPPKASGPQLGEIDNVVQRRVKGYGYNHGNPSFQKLSQLRRR